MAESAMTTLRATTRSMRRCRALKTRPRAPWPMWSSKIIAAEGKPFLPLQEPAGLEPGERPFLDELTGQGR